MPSDKSKLLAATVSSSKNGSHSFVKSRSDVKSLAVESQKLEGNKNSNFVSTPKPAVRKKCFRCGSVSHLIYNCPEKARSGEMRAKHASMNSAEVQVDRCQVDSEHVITAAGLGPGPQPAGLDAPVGGQQQVRDATQQAAVAARHAHAHTHVDPVLADGWSELHYVQVAVKGLTETICALCDSGTQLCCVDASVIEPLNLPRLGHVMLRGLSTDLVRADLVCLHVKLVNADEVLPVTCAVCDKLNAPM